MKTNVKMNCTNCGTQIDVDDLLISQFEQSIRQDLESELSKKEQELKKDQKKLQLLQADLEKRKEGMDEVVSKEVKTQVSKREEILKRALRKEIDEEKSAQLQELEQELKNKSAKLKELNSTKAQLEVLKREIEEKETEITLKKEKEFTKRLEEARSVIKQAHEESFLKLKEREKLINDLKVKLQEAQRKADQGSMQMQGDIQELEIIELLKEAHPIDDISQSKKGANAADILQVVKTQNGGVCGKIYYESKRTKTWSNSWIPKFKEDALREKADILVLVTDALPKDIKRYGIIDGVWICGFNDVSELSLVLRYGLLKLQTIAIIQHGKETKMDMLYKYLTSEQFKAVFESILKGFKTLQDSHQSEKLKMMRMWKEREKTLEQVLANSVDFYGVIKGIAGADILEIKMLDPNQVD
ncbi:MAG: DUF2130 domain-containing protein [Bacteroidetes bacterium]|nr:DUF2130 domain-containing protein [Bacteroidota bacterium]